MRRGQRRVLSAALAGLALLAAGCAVPLAPVPVGAPVPLAAPAPLRARPAGPPPDVVLVVPPGTFAAEMRGEPAFSMPSHIRLVVGQSITVRNDDQAMHYFFDVPVAPGQSFRKTFSKPGSFGYSPGLSCSLAREGGVTVEVVQP
jgi:hypothetical protein